MIKLAPPKGKTEPSFLWTGDRWQSACRSTVIAQGVSPIGPDLGCVKAWVRRRSLCVLLLARSSMGETEAERGELLWGAGLPVLEPAGVR